MKKLLLTVVLAAFAFAANAQFVVGGNIAFLTNGGSMKYTAGTTEMNVPAADDGSGYFAKGWSLLLAPKVGYQLNDKMQAGISLQFETGSEKNYTPYVAGYAIDANFEGWSQVSYSAFGIAPYFRYTLCTLGKFNVFCEAQAAFEFIGKDKYHDFNTAISSVGVAANDDTYEGSVKGFIFDFTVTPGLNYKINDNISADLYVDLLGLEFLSVKTTDDNYSGTNDVRVNTENTFGFVANLAPQTLNSHLGLFRLGFNYHF